MIVVDSSVWIDHLRASDPRLVALLEAEEAGTHPLVIGELACGSIRQREALLRDLCGLPMVPTAAHEEVMAMVRAHRLWGVGLGWVDAHLLASCRVAGAGLWTRDGVLARAARRVGVEAGED